MDQDISLEIFPEAGGDIVGRLFSCSATGYHRIDFVLYFTALMIFYWFNVTCIALQRK